jgi:hypothetical protein
VPSMSGDKDTAGIDRCQRPRLKQRTGLRSITTKAPAGAFVRFPDLLGQAFRGPEFSPTEPSNKEPTHVGLKPDPQWIPQVSVFLLWVGLQSDRTSSQEPTHVGLKPDPQWIPQVCISSVGRTSVRQNLEPRTDPCRAEARPTMDPAGIYIPSVGRTSVRQNAAVGIEVPLFLDADVRESQRPQGNSFRDGRRPPC